MKLFYIIKAIFFDGYFKVIIRKIYLRFFDTNSTQDYNDRLNWLKNNETSLKRFCESIDKNLWEETEKATNEILNNSKEILDKIKYDLGGGGSIKLLYFLTRLTKPKTVVETGVAAGFSSYSILQAIHRNKYGFLHSSDFPYFRLPNPKKFIGIVIPDFLKKNWQLYVDGDKKNLKKIINSITQIDLFHYDSDKSYKGRGETLNFLSEYCNEKTILIMDDIEDNSFFFDEVHKIDFKKKWKVFFQDGKWIGLIFNQI